MIGIMSLLDTLFGIDIRQIVDKLEIPDEIIHALLHREGQLGWQLRLIEARERRDVEQVNDTMTALQFLDDTSLAKAELNALEWANHINQQSV